MEKSYYVEVQTEVHGAWSSNALRFGSKEEAHAYGRNLWAKWTAVRDWRIAEGNDLVTHKWINDRLLEK